MRVSSAPSLAVSLTAWQGDEGKPVCQNCKSKSLSCRYGLNVTFVESKSQAAFKLPEEATIYPTLRFVQVPPASIEESPSPVSSLPGPSRQSILVREVENQELPELQQQIPNTPAPDSAPVSFATPYELGLCNNVPSTRQRQESVSTSTSSPSAGLLNPSHHFRPWSPAVSPSSPSFILPQERQPSLEELHKQPNIVLTNGPLDSRERYELDLLTYYRYQIAPRLDLGVGGSYFGVRVLLRAERSPQLYYAILALSSCQRAATDPSYQKEDETQLNHYRLKAQEDVQPQEDEDRRIITVLLALKDLLLASPRSWTDGTAFLHISFGSTDVVNMLEDTWQVSARMKLAASLVGASTSASGNLSFVVQGATPVFLGQRLTHKEQLRQTFSILGRALMMTPSDSNSRQSLGLPLNSLWQSCWSDNQLWYSARNGEMQQVFEVDQAGILPTQQQVVHTPFPIIVFSNTCALMANLVHHLAALYLLHHKPRLTKALAEAGSSTSPVWHAQRLVGIVTSFDEAEVLDALVVAAILYASRRLSHPAQLAMVVSILRKASATTGLKLEEEIQNVESAYRMTTHG